MRPLEIDIDFFNFKEVYDMIDATAIKASLDKAINEFAAHPENFSRNPGSDFTRDRKMPASDVLRFLILMERDSVDMELLKYFGHDLVATPTQPAYIQQRSKLVPDTFKMLLAKFNAALPAAVTYQEKYILYGVDGSGFNIAYNPNDPDTFNPPSGKSKLGNNEIHVVASYRLTDHLFTDAVIQPGRKKNEYAAICDLIDNCSLEGGTPIFLADRGFPSYNMFAHAVEKGVKFLVRAKDLYVKRLLGNDYPAGEKEFDVTVTRIVTRSNSKKERSSPDAPELYRYVDRNTKFDFMEPGSHGEYSVTVRVVRVKVSEGVYENLITNLSADEFDRDALRTLYYIRWGLETAFRYLKHAVGASDFHCRSFENVSHEVWARLILFNCCSAISALAVPEKPENSKYDVYQVNYTMAIKNVHIFLRQKETETPIGIVAVIKKYICPVRPKRRFERRHRYQTPLKFGYRH